MLKCEILGVHGFNEAIHGMRNPMNSWAKSDSGDLFDTCDTCRNIICDNCLYDDKGYCIGPNDLGLMKKLFKAGTEHRKYARMINVYMNIEAPLYWWKEFDTYKVGTVANSCSTMHKISEKEFTLDMFSHEHLFEISRHVLKDTIDSLNDARDEFLETKDKEAWWQMIQLLPSSYNQKRTVMLNYEVAANIIRQRSGHKLDEWRVLVDALEDLPYMAELIGNS